MLGQAHSYEEAERLIKLLSSDYNYCVSDVIFEIK